MYFQVSIPIIIITGDCINILNTIYIHINRGIKVTGTFVTMKFPEN